MDTSSSSEGDFSEQHELLEAGAPAARPRPVKLALGVPLALVGAVCGFALVLPRRSASHLLRAGSEGDMGLREVNVDCSAYMRDNGCNWTLTWNCHGQTGGAHTASDDGSQGYQCCCERGLWIQSQVSPNSTLTGDYQCAGGSYRCTHQYSKTWQCKGLSHQKSATTPEMCEALCCESSDCKIWQFASLGEKDRGKTPECWTGGKCKSGGEYHFRFGGQKVTECAADWGSSLGEPVCCGQTGKVSGLEHVCPASAPTCEGYAGEDSWGTCRPQKHPCLPKCVSGKQKIELYSAAEKMGAADMLSHAAFDRLPYPPTDTQLSQAGIYAGATEYLMQYLNSKVLPDVIQVFEGKVNAALLEIDKKLIDKTAEGDIPILAGGQVELLHFWGFSIDSISVNFVAGAGIQIVISGMSITGYCQANLGTAVVMSTSGNVNFGMSDGSLALLVIPTISSEGKLEFLFGTEAVDSGLYLQFKTKSWFDFANPLNWIPNLLAKSAALVLAPIIRDAVESAILTALGGALNPNMSVHLPTSSKTAIDMSAVAANTYWMGMLIAVSGAPESKDSSLQYEKPACPSTMPAQKSVVAEALKNKPWMFGFSVRQYVINGQLYMMQATGELQLEVPSADTRLTTSFDGKCAALNPSIPPCSIGRTFGNNTPVSWRISASAAPEVNISESSIILSIPLSMDFVADGASDIKSGLIFTLAVPLQLGVSLTANSTQKESSSGETYSRTSFSVELTTLSLTPMKVTKMGDGVKRPLMIGTKISNLKVKDLIDRIVIPGIQSKLSQVWVDVPKPLVDTRLLLEAGAVTLASNIMLPRITTTTTTLGPALPCDDKLDLAGSCYSGNGKHLQPCYTCQYWQCNRVGRRRGNQYWSCNR